MIMRSSAGGPSGCFVFLFALLIVGLLVLLGLFVARMIGPTTRWLFLK